MIKKLIVYIALFILTFNWLSAKVGINTNNPLDLFHIDPNANTSSVGVNDTDDFIITYDGKVGIGTANIQATLHINENMRYSDGKEQVGYVLISKNVSGDTYWSEQQLVNQMILPDQSNIETIISNPAYNIKDYNPYYMGLNISSPWIVRSKISLKANYRQYIQDNKAYYGIYSTSLTTKTNIRKAYSSYSGSAFDAKHIMLVSNCIFVVNTTTINLI